MEGIFQKRVAMFLLFFVAFVGIGHFTGGLLMLPVILAGIVFASMRRRAFTLICFLLISFLSIINPQVIPPGGSSAMVGRLGSMVMVFALWSAQRESMRSFAFPLGAMVIYLVVAVVSSLAGMLPFISILKIVNMSLFLTGLYMGTRNMSQDADELLWLRAFFFSFAAFIVVGSVIMLLVFPGAAYITSLRHTFETLGAEGAYEQLKQSNALRLFAGITSHSQLLGTLLGTLNAWLLFDMVMIERRASKWHLALLALLPVVMYMTHSRAGMFGFVVSWAVAILLAVRSSSLTGTMRGRMQGVLLAMVVAGVCALAVAAMLKPGLIEGIIRKTADVEEDTRNRWEAFNSRQGQIEQSWSIFKRHPVLGIGFQISEELVFHAQAVGMGKLMFSAPIEKGFLLTMVLEETGVIGGIAFCIFLSITFTACGRMRLYATQGMLLTFLALNVGEASFFAPSGSGGCHWCFVFGGFMLDVMAKSIGPPALSFRVPPATVVVT